MDIVEILDVLEPLGVFSPGVGPSGRPFGVFFPPSSPFGVFFLPASAGDDKIWRWSPRGNLLFGGIFLPAPRGKLPFGGIFLPASAGDDTV